MSELDESPDDIGMAASEDGSASVLWSRTGAVVNVVIHVDPPPPARILNPCDLGQHRWAWLVDGRQACGYCGKPR